MPHTCKKCRNPFTREERATGYCPHCGVPFDTAELVALCIGILCTYLFSLTGPELARALLQGGWTPPDVHTVIVRICVVTPPLFVLLLYLSFRYDLWQGAALNAHPWLRLLWFVAAPGLLWAALILVIGVGFVSLRRRCTPRRAFLFFLEDKPRRVARAR